MPFDGHIVGLGFADGTRIVVGMWQSSPLGAFADAMVQSPDGHRTLLAPTPQVSDLVSSTYTFDTLRVVDVSTSGWSFTGGPLEVSWRPGGRALVGHLLRLVPGPVRESQTWARACDPVARRVMPGVRTHGSAGNGRTEWYAARDAWDVHGAEARWEGVDLGPLTAVDPPVEFGFGSAPRRPTLTRLTSFVRLP